MKAKSLNIPLRELFKDYINNDEEGVWAYGGKLCVRPSYQREYVYDEKRRNKVMDTIRKGMPINTIWFAKVGEDSYEVMDGQQRIISILNYLNGSYSKYDNLLDMIYFFQNLPKEEQEKVLDYEIEVKIFEGSSNEKLDWFKTINIGGLVLEDQELRNAAYTGPWLEDAKRHFSKTNCVAYQKGKDYIKGNPIRQEYLETVLYWKAHADGFNIKDKGSAIEQYMSIHQHDENAEELWDYFLKVINWIQLNFSTYYKEMKGLEWGILYNKYHSQDYNTIALEKKVKDLMANDEIQAKKGIFEYLLGGEVEEKLLNPRKFSESMKRTAFERQKKLWKDEANPLEPNKSVCPLCHNKFEFKDMEGDHILAWKFGGRTELDNLQMLCRKCNKEKSSKGGY